MDPTMLLERDGSQRFSSIWIKGIRAVDLSVHCIDSLIGPRFGKDELKYPRDVVRVPLDEPCPAYYLCSLPHPYTWPLNGHILAFPAPGQEHEVTLPGLTVTLFGLRPTPIRAEWLLDPERYGDNRAYTTCRNLQAAWFMHTECGLENRRNNERDQYRRRTANANRRRPAQTGLFD